MLHRVLVSLDPLVKKNYEKESHYPVRLENAVYSIPLMKYHNTCKHIINFEKKICSAETYNQSIWVQTPTSMLTMCH